MGPIAAILPGNRLHLQHGPIDLVIGADGPVDQVKATCLAARARFQTILPVLVGELPALRRPVQPGQRFDGPVAQRMAEAVLRNTDVFVTPMAAVAGSVADEVLAAMRTAAPALPKIWVNNGGDIAVHLAGDATFEAAMIADPATGREAGRLTLRACDGIGGVATSGRHGRSLSLGIADAVTVLARNAASADVAATLIANAVDLPGHPAIHRTPAQEIDPDSDLGERLVVIDVGELLDCEIAEALAGGLTVAERMISKGLIHSANLCLAGQTGTTHPVIPALSGDPGKRPRRSFNSSLGHHAWTPGQAGGDGREFSHALT
ncbi:UPF0280 family protein [Minwuia sp.]|uniref:UPF0280 family protein n=1 Tax=Minwuia sp. TaxID=2493630 RepID=UPI003A8E43D4